MFYYREVPWHGMGVKVETAGQMLLQKAVE
jgi:hypothetical protein